ncbi:hypothetical protein NE237_017006 [Protea cynaroides]|uniref:CN hydrolase domain-containing protein n=1 Tax=Protea cynaroides TaxID=273540 RepID=A0A9Q0QMA5_9MAGN|nr:hypothetical protein NE237_017006 [Protea cynaroides]
MMLSPSSQQKNCSSSFRNSNPCLFCLTPLGIQKNGLDPDFGKIAINICYGRHHPLNWLAFGLNGAKIVFNPSATVGELSEPMWPIEHQMLLAHHLSRSRDGLMISDMDLNICRQVKDKWGLRMAARYALYADLLGRYVKKHDFEPQVIVDYSLKEALV